MGSASVRVGQLAPGLIGAARRRDWPHLPFVHRRTIGHNLPLTADGSMAIDVDERPWGFHTTVRIDGEPQDAALDYRFPNAMQLHLPAGKRVLGLMNVCLPIDETSTSMIFVTVRDFLRPRVFDGVFNHGNRRIAGEDRAVLESSVPVVVPPPAEERSVRTDEPTLRFRKIFRERLSGSSAGGVRAHVDRGAVATPADDLARGGPRDGGDALPVVRG